LLSRFFVKPLEGFEPRLEFLKLLKRSGSKAARIVTHCDEHLSVALRYFSYAIGRAKQQVQIRILICRAISGR
jgi:hypothetical protein